MCRDRVSSKPKKIIKSTIQLEFLGIIIDCTKMELRISIQLLSLIGKLSFISRVVKWGITLVRRMIDSAKSKKYLHYNVKLNSCFRTDLAGGSSFWTHGMGVNVIQGDWCTDNILELPTDTSGTAKATVHQNEWFCAMFIGNKQWIQSMSIAWREMYAVVKALATWAPN